MSTAFRQSYDDQTASLLPHSRVIGEMEAQSPLAIGDRPAYHHHHRPQQPHLTSRACHRRLRTPYDALHNAASEPGPELSLCHRCTRTGFVPMDDVATLFSQ